MFTLLDELANDLTAPVSTPVPMTEPAAGQ
jgi:hypothetical protein